MNASQERAAVPASAAVARKFPEHATHRCARIWFLENEPTLLYTCSCGERFYVPEEDMEDLL